MGDLIGGIIVILIIAGIVVGVGLAIVFVIFTLFFVSVWFGGVLGWLLSLTFLGEWVSQGFATFGFHDVNLAHVGALLGFIGGLAGVRIVTPVISAIIDWGFDKIKEES